VDGASSLLIAKPADHIPARAFIAMPGKWGGRPLDEAREAYYVLYGADAERLWPLSGTIIEYLAPPKS
jgi:hypothetical protein